MATVFYATGLALVVSNNIGYWNVDWSLDMVLYAEFERVNVIDKKPLTGISDFSGNVMSVCKGNILLIILAQSYELCNRNRLL